MLPELDTRITGRKNETELEESLRMTKFGKTKNNKLCSRLLSYKIQSHVVLEAL
jgi:hypothetical protein